MKTPKLKFKISHKIIIIKQLINKARSKKWYVKEMRGHTFKRSPSPSEPRWCKSYPQSGWPRGSGQSTWASMHAQTCWTRPLGSPHTGRSTSWTSAWSNPASPTTGGLVWSVAWSPLVCWKPLLVLGVCWGWCSGQIGASSYTNTLCACACVCQPTTQALRLGALELRLVYTVSIFGR